MRLSERIYRILIEMYPASYLRRYQEPMVQLFSDQVQRTGGHGALLRLWLRTLGDLLCTVPQQYFQRLRRRSMFGSYSEPARRSIFFARYTAATHGHGSITAEDLLAGLLREDRDTRRRLDLDPLDATLRAMDISARPARRIRAADHIPLNEAVKQILSLAAQEAQRSGAKQITPHHLLQAIVAHGKTPAAEVLRRHLRP